jgi:hypothetical protein
VHGTRTQGFGNGVLTLTSMTITRAGFLVTTCPFWKSGFTPAGASTCEVIISARFLEGLQTGNRASGHRHRRRWLFIRTTSRHTRGTKHSRYCEPLARICRVSAKTYVHVNRERTIATATRGVSSSKALPFNLLSSQSTLSVRDGGRENKERCF